MTRKLIIAAAGLLAALALERAHAGRGASLAVADRHHRGAVPAGGRRRRAGAHRGRAAVGRHEGDGRGREPPRRWRHRRHACGREGGARRLHADDGAYRHHRDQPKPLCQCRLRPAQGFHRHRDDRLDAGRADRASVVSGQDRCRRDRDREERAGQAQFRHLGDRHRRLSHRGIFQVRGRPADADRALSGYRAADERPDRRACAGFVRRAAARHGQHPGRQVARHRGHRTRVASACCRTCRPPPNPGCRASIPSCSTG